MTFEKIVRQTVSVIDKAHCKMSQLWIDKHRPHTLSKLSLHPEITSKLTSLATSDEVYTERFSSNFVQL